MVGDGDERLGGGRLPGYGSGHGGLLHATPAQPAQAQGRRPDAWRCRGQPMQVDGSALRVTGCPLICGSGQGGDHLRRGEGDQLDVGTGAPGCLRIRRSLPEHGCAMAPQSPRWSGTGPSALGEGADVADDSGEDTGGEDGGVTCARVRGM